MKTVKYFLKVVPVTLALLISFGMFALAHGAEFMSVKNASELSQSGQILLVDIRRPDEWKQDGIPASAYAISMHVEGFLDKLGKLTKGDKNAKIALICATGARSTWLGDQLEARGYTSIINVAEGMYGSQRGPGWLAAKLPVKNPG